MQTVPIDIFVHIMKTAGSTLAHITDRQYPAGTIFDEGRLQGDDYLRVAQVSPRKRMGVRLLRGHMPYGLHTHFGPRPVRYFTFLRDPVERVVSYYYHIRHHPEHYLYDAVVAQRMSLAEFLDSGHSRFVANAQVRVISGAYLEPPIGGVTPAMLQQAQANLARRFVVVGLTERFDMALLLLRRALQWEAPIRYTRKNVGRGRPRVEAIAPETIARIEALNRFDRALYEYAETLFQRQIKAYGARFWLDLARFAARNRAHNMYWGMRRVSVRTMVREWWSARSSRA